MKNTPYWGYSLKRRNYDKDSRIHYEIGIKTKNYTIFPSFTTWRLFHLLVDYQFVNHQLQVKEVSQHNIVVKYQDKEYRIIYLHRCFFQVYYNNEKVLNNVRKDQILRFFKIPKKIERSDL